MTQQFAEHGEICGHRIKLKYFVASEAQTNHLETNVLWNDVLKGHEVVNKF